MRALPPGSTIGILGGGQLGRMLALAAARLGFKCHIYNDVDGPACQIAAATTLGAFDDLAKLKAFAASSRWRRSLRSIPPPISMRLFVP
jgi:5-(carboxyamino)imidazole ribonucleotide synthase